MNLCNTAQKIRKCARQISFVLYFITLGAQTQHKNLKMQKQIQLQDTLCRRKQLEVPESIF